MNRKRDFHEYPEKPQKLSRHGTQRGCKTCYGIRHNSKTTQRRIKELSIHLNKQGKGKPRKHPKESSNADTIPVGPRRERASTKGRRRR